MGGAVGWEEQYGGRSSRAGRGSDSGRRVGVAVGQGGGGVAQGGAVGWEEQ